jgi:primosomal protein N' (replication factor Y) (superfamily II helicase)
VPHRREPVPDVSAVTTEPAATTEPGDRHTGEVTADGPRRIAQVVVEVEPIHLDRPFDYLVPDDLEVVVGQRVQVAFAGRRVRGLVVGLPELSEVDVVKLRPIARSLGEHAWVREDELPTLRWAADRFGAPLADVVRHALPSRVVDVERRAAAAGWFPPGTGRRPTSDPPPAPAALDEAWAPYADAGRDLLDAVRDGAGSYLWRPLPGEDVAGRVAELAQLTLAGDRDVLVTVPDPASPIADAVVRAAGDLAVDVRDGPSDRRLYRAWLEARCGVARVVVGQLGSVFMPLERLGLAVVLDEANPALKARSSPRHHAREVVLERARRAGGVGLAVGTVPSAVAWRLLRDRRLTPVIPTRDRERAARPRVRVVTGHDQPRARLLRETTSALRKATRAGEYGVVLASRRGQGAALVCGGCGDRLACPTCASSVAVEALGDERRPGSDRRTDDGARSSRAATSSGGRSGGTAGVIGVLCEGCGWNAPRVPACPNCGQRRVVPLAAGAERLGQELERSLQVPVVVLEGYGRTAPPPPAVLVMTRGSVLDEPPGRVGAVVLPDLDAMVRRPSLDASEDALRLAVAVARWTVHGRRDPADSEVVVQTREPEHPVVRALEAWDPGRFWRTEIEQRAVLRFPPLTHAIRVTVPAGSDAATVVGDQIRAALEPGDELLGPLPTGDREGFLLKAEERDAGLAALRPLREAWGKEGLDVRVDVDPVDAL